MILCLLLTRGPNEQLMAPFFIYQNHSGNYFIRSVPPAPYCLFRTQRSTWMDRTIFLQWLDKPEKILTAPEGQLLYLFLDYAAGHSETSSVTDTLTALRTELRLLPANSTNKTQLLDLFFIRDFKTI